jgi:hypothetical protein
VGSILGRARESCTELFEVEALEGEGGSLFFFGVECSYKGVTVLESVVRYRGGKWGTKVMLQAASAQSAGKCWKSGPEGQKGEFYACSTMRCHLKLLLKCGGWSPSRGRDS